MPVHTTFHKRLLIILSAFGALLFCGCPPTVDCDVLYPDGRIPEIVFSDYCDPDFLEFDLLECSMPDITDFPDFCAGNYSFSRVFRLDNKADMIYLHRYRNFTSDIILEFIVNGDNGYELLNDCSTATSQQLVSVSSIKTRGHKVIFVRVVYRVDPAEVLNDNQKASLTFAVFDAPYEYEADPLDSRKIPTDCAGRPFNLIASGDNAEAYAQSLGLPYRVCKCDAGIVEIDLPEGIQLDAVRPKVPQEKTGNDTTTVSFNFVIETPTDPQIVKYDDDQDLTDTSIYDFRNDAFLNFNRCLYWAAPAASGSNGTPLRVTIIDSGIDNATLGPVIDGSLSELKSSVNCNNEGKYGYDFIDDDPEPDDIIGHGTLVASAFINGLQPEGPVSLANYKFIQGNTGTLFDAMCATSSAIRQKSHIINMSWGFRSDTIPDVLDGLLELAYQEGILIVTSAGNDTTDVKGNPPYWPAAAGEKFPNVIPVASYQINNSGVVLTNFSNHNPDAVKLAAIYGIETRGMGGEHVFPAGTSISAPIITAWLAGKLKPGDDPLLVLDQLLNDTTFVGETTALAPYVLRSRYLKLPDPDNDCR